MGADSTDAIAGLVAELASAWQSERLVYRSITSDDADIAFIHGVNSDPVNVAMSGSGLLRPYARTTASSLVGMLEKSLLAVMVCIPALNEEKPPPIGFLCIGFGGEDLIHPQSHNRHALLGIALATAHQNKGYGTEAVRWALGWAFRFANLHSVGLDVVEFNEKARRVYEHIGFVREGRSREVVFCGGRYWDLLHYSILDREWNDARKERTPK